MSDFNLSLDSSTTHIDQNNLINSILNNIQVVTSYVAVTHHNVNNHNPTQILKFTIKATTVYI